MLEAGITIGIGMAVCSIITGAIALFAGLVVILGEWVIDKLKR